MSWNTVKALLIDLSGTIHVEDEAILGAVDAVNQLRKSGIPFKFVTNTSKESQRVLVERLQRIGFRVRSEDIFSSLTAARAMITSQGLRPFLILADEAMEDFEDLDTNNPNAVVMGLAPKSFDYETMNKAFEIIQGGGQLMAINKSRYFKKKAGLTLGTGCFVAGLEYSTGVKAKVIGKPEASFFLSALDSLNNEFELGTQLTPQETVMIGDDIQDDVFGAQEAGFQGCLVKTGKYQDNDETKFDGRADYVVDSVSKVVDLLIESKK